MMNSIDEDFKATLKIDELIKKFRNLTYRNSLFQKITKAIDDWESKPKKSKYPKERKINKNRAPCVANHE